MTQINRPELQLLATEIEQAVQAVAEKHGIQIKRGNGTYDADGSHASLKIEMSVLGEDGKAVSPDAGAFEQYSQYDGIPADALNKRFGAYTFVGYKPRNRKYPYLVTIAGKTGTYKLPTAKAMSIYEAGQ